MPKAPHFFARLLRRTMLVFALALILAALSIGWWLNHPLQFSAEQKAVEVTIPLGSSAVETAQAVADAGLNIAPRLLSLGLRASGKAHQIQAGRYRFAAPISPWEIMVALIQGKQAPLTIRLLEGSTWEQVRQTLLQNPNLKHLSKDWDEAQVMQALGRPGEAAEGRFFPDTYHFYSGVSDVQILRQALTRMDDKLAQAWAQRQPNLPYTDSYQALIMGSIIEKETSKEEERPLVAAVFVNRMRKGMRLQTDPTVIYGLGTAFNGDLKRIHLETDHPYNSYTRAGLPPTPIAVPSMASLLAAVQPAKSKMLYFVGRGDGSSHFSATLAEHNRAVRQYQLNQ